VALVPKGRPTKREEKITDFKIAEINYLKISLRRQVKVGGLIIGIVAKGLSKTLN